MRKSGLSGGYRDAVLHRARSLAVPASCLLLGLLAGACAGGSSGEDAHDLPSTASSSKPAASPGSVVTDDPGSGLLAGGLDVCSLVSPAQVRRAVGQVGEPTSRLLTTVPRYGGLVDQCGFGVSFNSYTFVLSVGLRQASRADLRTQPGEPVAGVGDAARAADQGRFTTVAFLRGRTFARVLATKPSPEASRLGAVEAVAAAVARSLPTDPPETDEQTRGACRGVDQKAVDAVLGEPSAVSRTLEFKNRSLMCSFATGTTRPRTLALTYYSSQQAGQFFSDQRLSEPHTDLKGIASEAFTVPGSAFAVSADGQAVSVGGTFGGPTGAKPLPASPALKALLASGASLFQ